MDGLTKQSLFNAQLLYWFCYYSVGHCSYIYLFSFYQVLCIVATILQYIGFVTVPTVTTSVSAAAVPLPLPLLMLLQLWLLLMLQRPSVKWVLGCHVHETTSWGWPALFTINGDVLSLGAGHWPNRQGNRDPPWTHSGPALNDDQHPSHTLSLPLPPYTHSSLMYVVSRG